MLYIVCALKPEAQAFVDKYKLKAQKLDGYKIFTSASIVLIVGGLGVDSTRKATQTLINHFDIIDDDIYLNIGICGANKEYRVSDLIEISDIVYEDISYSITNKSAKTIHCLNQEVSTDEYEIVDMESYGFYDGVIHSPAIKNFYIFKVVSDHFEPETVTKDKTKMLIFNAIDDIINAITYEEIS